jgi:P27 family predicted phage terminase small subunit
MPPWLTDRAVVVWGEVVPALVHMGYVAPCDASVIAAYCEAEAERRRLAMLVAQSTPLLQSRHSVGRSGEPDLVRNPLMMMFVHTTMSVARLAADLGLSPRGRTELRFLSQPTEDDRMRLLSG